VRTGKGLATTAAIDPPHGAIFQAQAGGMIAANCYGPQSVL